MTKSFQTQMLSQLQKQRSLALAITLCVASAAAAAQMASGKTDSGSPTSSPTLVITSIATVSTATISTAALSAAAPASQLAPQVVTTTPSGAVPSATTTAATGQTRSLLPLVQPLWSELSASQASTLAPMAGQWNSFTLADKRSWIKLANGFAKLPADQQQKATARMVEWTQLTPEQRLRVRSNFGIAKQVPQEQRVAEFQQYRAMTPEQRRVLRSAGTTSNTAALYAGTRTGLAPEAAQPIIKTVVPPATVKR